MNDNELIGVTFRWACDLDKDDYLVYPKGVDFKYKGGDDDEKEND